MASENPNAAASAIVRIQHFNALCVSEARDGRRLWRGRYWNGEIERASASWVSSNFKPFFGVCML